MAEKNYVKVGGQLQNIVGDGILAYSKEIKDEVREKTQEQINTETYEKVAEIDEALSSLSPEQGEALALSERVGQLEKEVGYYECSTSSSTATKQVVADGYALSSGCSIKVKMLNKNTVATNVKLKIGSSEAKPLYYAGKLVSAANTWDAGEVLDIYYNPNNGGAYYANNVEGGSADGVFDISDYNKSGDPLEPTKYIDLAAALGTNGNNIPENHRKGGMLIKFIELESLEYKQYRYMGTAVSGTSFTNTANWQGADSVPTEDSRNLVESGGVFEECVEAGDPVGDPVGDWVPSEAEAYVDQKVAEERARAIARENQLLKVYETFTQSNLVIGALPATGKVNTIYRVPGTNSYADYMYAASDLHTPILMATYNNDIDEIPTAGSQNLVKSGGVAREIVWDVTARNSNATFASLSALLSDANLATLIPTTIRRGGMQIRFVLSSDNKYVQYMYKVTDAATAATFTNVANWDKINIIEDVNDRFGNNYKGLTATQRVIILNGGDGTTLPSPSVLTGWGYYDIPIDAGTIITVKGSGGASGLYGFVNADNKIISWSGASVAGTYTIIAPEGTVRIISNVFLGSPYSINISLSSSVQKSLYGFDVRTKSSLNEKSIQPTFYDGKYIYSTGAIANNANYKYGTFDAQQGDIIVVDVSSNSGGCVIGIKKSADETAFSPCVQSGNKTQYIYVCEFDCIVGFSGLKVGLTCRVISSRIDRDLQGYGTPYATKRIFPQYSITDGKYITTSGAIATLNGYAYTSKILMKKGTSVILNTGNVSSSCSTLSEVSEDGNFIRSLYTGDGVEETKYYQIDKTGYYVICCRNNKINYFAIIEFANGDLFFNNPLDNLFLNMESNAVPPREILRSPSFVGIVHKWGFIGDSLSSGEQAVYEDGTTTLIRPDKYDYSWGQRMCSLNSVEGFNFSAGGQTTKGWCNGAGEREWGGAQLEANWKQAYCIALGVNDRSASYPVGDADTDIDLTNYNNNADTFAGWYAGIIQRLRSVNPKCRIFCITIPYNNQQGYLDNNEVIREIVPKFSKCYLVDLANYHWTPNGLALNDHLSPAGYQWAAWEINTYIDWIIRNNMSDFRDIAFVGTNYSADIQ